VTHCICDAALYEDENYRNDQSKDRETRMVVRTDKHGGAYVTSPTTGTTDIRLLQPKKTTKVLEMHEGDDYIIYRTRQDGVYILVRMDKAAEVIGEKYLSPTDLNTLTSEIEKARLSEARRRHRHRKVILLSKR
jgi:bifunctional DNA-binding transcriptional regulator/antitoxin component of YhaV-PrlF toxin-antitoxin module